VPDCYMMSNVKETVKMELWRIMFENDVCIIKLRGFHSGYCSDFGFGGCDTV
jgi:hypothetical protein